MNISLLKRLYIFIAPAAILAAAFLALPRMAAISPPWREIAPYAPFAAIILGMLLSLHFHRGKVFFVLLMLAIFYQSLRLLPPDGTTFPSQVLFPAFAILLPFNMTLFCFMRERGVLTMAGRLRFGFIALQAGLLGWVIRYNYVDVPRILNHEFFPSPVLSSLSIPQPAIIVMATGAILIAVRMFKRQSPADSAFLGAMVAAAVAGANHGTPDMPLLFITAAGAILNFGVLQDSYNMAYRDDLTGLPSRRALNEDMAGLGRRYAIAMLDVDHFKRFNDTYGHDVGDQVLKMVAGKLHSVAGGGKAFRYGGEEFTILFPRKKASQAIPHLEEVRKGIAAYELRLRGSDRPKGMKKGEKQREGKGEAPSVSVTISIGIAESGEGCGGPADVIKGADKALYRAKNQGRNRLSR